jgi:adenine-specific DNA methylase
LTNLENKIDNITQIIRKMREELKELKKSREAQQSDQSFLMVSIFESFDLVIYILITLNSNYIL